MGACAARPRRLDDPASGSRAGPAASFATIVVSRSRSDRHGATICHGAARGSRRRATSRSRLIREAEVAQTAEPVPLLSPRDGLSGRAVRVVICKPLRCLGSGCVEHDTAVLEEQRGRRVRARRAGRLLADHDSDTQPVRRSRGTTLRQRRSSCESARPAGSRGRNASAGASATRCNSPPESSDTGDRRAAAHRRSRVHGAPAARISFGGVPSSPSPKRDLACRCGASIYPRILEDRVATRSGELGRLRPRACHCRRPRRRFRSGHRGSAERARRVPAARSTCRLRTAPKTATAPPRRSRSESVRGAPGSQHRWIRERQPFDVG